MTVPTTYEAVLILLIGFAPGFLFVVTARRSNLVSTDKLEIKSILWMIIIGMTLQAVYLLPPFGSRCLLSWYQAGEIYDHLIYLSVWGLFACVLIPSGLGLLSGRVITWPKLDNQLDKYGLGFVDRLPAAWDYAFWRFPGGLVIVHLDDGTATGGLLGSVGTLRDTHDVFLSQVWSIDSYGNLEAPKLDSVGVWIRHDTIQRIEFFAEWEDGVYAQTAIPGLQDSTATTDQASDGDSGS